MHKNNNYHKQTEFWVFWKTGREESEINVDKELEADAPKKFSTTLERNEAAELINNVEPNISENLKNRKFLAQSYTTW